MISKISLALLFLDLQRALAGARALAIALLIIVFRLC
jgi:hypothetical protein